MGFAFPNYKNLPAHPLQCLNIPPVPRYIPFTLDLPELTIRFRNHLPKSARVHVPKATVNENDFFAGRENQIWFSGKAPVVENITKSHTVGHGANKHFRLCILAANRGHVATALLRGQYVGHE